MPETFRYRAHFRWLRFVFLAGAAAAPLLAWISPSVLFPAAIVAIEFLGGAYLMHRLASTEIELTDEALIARFGKKTKLIPLSSIERIDFPSIRYAGGWMKVRSSLESIRIPVTLKDVSILLERLTDRIDRRTHDPVALERFMRTAVLADHSWDRMEENWGKFVLFGAFGASFSAILISATVQASGPLVVSAMVSLLAIMVPFLVGELILIRDFRKRALADGAPRRPGRNRTLERKIYGRVFPAALLVAAVALISQAAVLLSSRTEATAVAPAHRCHPQADVPPP